jgi:hypothetical protein
MSIRFTGLVCAVSCLAALSLAGCADPDIIPIRGEVLYKGAPLKDVPQGLVRYIPKTSSGAARQASGRIQPDGSFELTTFKSADGVVPGDYNIVVSAYASGGGVLSREQTEAGISVAGPRLIIPQKYISPTTSGLSDTVDSDHPGFKTIELSD